MRTPQSLTRSVLLDDPKKKRPARVTLSPTGVRQKRSVTPYDRSLTCGVMIWPKSGGPVLLPSKYVSRSFAPVTVCADPGPNKGPLSS